MFIIHSHSLSNREYLHTGKPTLHFALPSPVEVAIGSIDPSIDNACLVIAKLDPKNPEQQQEITDCLRILESAELNSTATVASVLAFRLKFGCFAPKLTKEFYTFFEEHVGSCWGAFYKIFETLAAFPHPDWGVLPRYASRFAHFYQAYQLLSDETARNATHAEQMAYLLNQCMIKFVATVPPDEVGHRYAGPKILRELILGMSLRFPNNTLLKTMARLTCTVYYDYLNSVLSHMRSYYQV